MPSAERLASPTSNSKIATDACPTRCCIACNCQAPPGRKRLKIGDTCSDSADDTAPVAGARQGIRLIAARAAKQRHADDAQYNRFVKNPPLQLFTDFQIGLYDLALADLEHFWINPRSGHHLK